MFAIVHDAFALQELQDVPRDGLPFAVGVGGEHDGAGGPRRAQNVPHDAVARALLPDHLEAALGDDAPALLHQVAHVAVGRQHDVAFAEVLLHGNRLRGGFHDDERFPGR
jgi:hypothetical protein